ATAAAFQLNFSSRLSQRDDALQGALAGVQAAVAEIRAASTTVSNHLVGVVSELPCTSSPSSPISGTIYSSGSGTTIQYSATITYTIKTSSGTAPATCTAGVGPAPSSQVPYTVVQADITSVGSDNLSSSIVPSRTVHSTYTFLAPTNADIAGGLIWSYNADNCWVVGPSAGGGNYYLDTIVSGSCSTSNTNEQFAYEPNYTIQTLIGGAAYCAVDPGQSQSGTLSSSQVTNADVLLEPCSTATPTPFDQQWGVQDSAEIEGVNTAGGPNSWCLTNADPVGAGAEQPVMIAGGPGGPNDCGEPYSDTWTWQMTSQVGSGGSNPTPGQEGPSDQLVNYLEFGRCMDVTNQNVGFGSLIDYTCKQFPDTAAYPIWNQRWCWASLSGVTGEPAGSGVLYTPQNLSGQCPTPADRPPSGVTPYCLQTAPDNATNPADQPSGGGPVQTTGGYNPTAVTVVQCSSLLSSIRSGSGVPAGDAAMVWVSTGASGTSLTDYTYVDNQGRCLQANSSTGEVWPSGAQGSGDAWTMIQVDTCDGNLSQRWNAPPDLAPSQVINTHE
ncbi:MAG: hypothetical protein ACYDEN_04990, partial [Acidimicrobiales bacterium]